MNKLNIKRFAGSPFTWNGYELKNIKRNGNGELIQADVYATVHTMGYSIDTIYEIDANGNTSWETNSWTIETESGQDTIIYKRYSFDTSDIKGIEVHNWSGSYTATLYFHFTVVDSDKTTYLTKTGDTAVLHGNVINNLGTWDYDNAPSVAAVRQYLSSNNFVHTSDIQNIVQETLLAAHPIGSIEINVSGTNPGTYLGGTWEAFGTGKTLVGYDTNDNDFSTIENTGGEKEHTLTIDEIPKHDHIVFIDQQGSGGKWGPTGTVQQSTNRYTSTGKTGNDQAHNNMPPYIVVYFWKRTA